VILQYVIVESRYHDSFGIILRCRVSKIHSNRINNMKREQEEEQFKEYVKELISMKFLIVQSTFYLYFVQLIGIYSIRQYLLYFTSRGTDSLILIVN
jgi:hypothetical protein